MTVTHPPTPRDVRAPHRFGSAPARMTQRIEGVIFSSEADPPPVALSPAQAVVKAEWLATNDPIAMLKTIWDNNVEATQPSRSNHNMSNLNLKPMHERDGPVAIRLFRLYAGTGIQLWRLHLRVDNNVHDSWLECHVSSPDAGSDKAFYRWSYPSVPSREDWLALARRSLAS